MKKFVKGFTKLLKETRKRKCGDMNYQESVEYVLSIPLFAQKLGTERLCKILELMGHPERNYKIIHVAGTNGKGSTCSFLMSILSAKGKRVGLFTSPHLVKINERIRINDQMILDDEFVDIFNQIMEYVELAKKDGIEHPSFFEFVFLMAVLYFAKKEVEYVILETGMGGRLDATNVVCPVVAIITSVGLDHTQFLGDTIEQIASEKAGIIKKNIPVIYFDRKDSATDIITNKCKFESANLHIVEKKQCNIGKITKKTIDFSFDSGYHRYDNLQIIKSALYQVENAMLAIKAYEILTLLDSVNDTLSENGLNYVDLLEQASKQKESLTDKDIDIIKTGLLNMTWSCRMEEIAEHIYVDGAHNEEAIEAFCETLEVMFSEEHKKLLFAVSKDKDYETMIERLCRIQFDEIILVRYEGSRSAELKTVEDTFRRFSSGKITTFEDIRVGFEYGKSHVENQFLFCVGSLYLAGDLLKIGV